ncbi:MAG: hypothetical protein JNM30_13630 [Rhodospirillales bacterium]|nr:hypothetical protein [Rhodospirillales bacterium]
MSSTSVSKLLEIGGPALSKAAPAFVGANAVERELAGLLAQRNGFLAFEAALHIYPSDPAKPLSLENVNSADGWRGAYPAIPADVLFFGQDIFGGQFGLRSGAVWTLDPETGDLTRTADTLEAFVTLLLRDYDVMVGHSLAHQWQATHGALKHDQRLAPKIPFVMGGEFTVDNLYAADLLPLMRARADIARQIADLPDGAQVELKIE